MIYYLIVTICQYGSNCVPGDYNHVTTYSERYYSAFQCQQEARRIEFQPNAKVTCVEGRY